ncbi:hypothetical protein GGS26DRAFT_596263 [Hypomontagnella submonticulosa]|nr:hypothetical protein GGS26DRAFT_596263 [Hypomontagnella submonticulosa]
MVVSRSTKTSRCDAQSASSVSDDFPANAQKSPKIKIPPGVGGSFYFTNPMQTNLILRFSDDGMGIPAAEPWISQSSAILSEITSIKVRSWWSKTQQPWVGLLQVKCDNIPQLMREGFFWSLDNVLWEQGFLGSPLYSSSWDQFDSDEGRNLREIGLSQRRSYFLRDIQHEPPRWIAHFQMYARSDEILARIRLENLRIENVFSAEAKASARQRLYKYLRCKPEASMNALYDNMAMEGWWPWPKRAKEESTNHRFATAEGGSHLN